MLENQPKDALGSITVQLLVESIRCTVQCAVIPTLGGCNFLEDTYGLHLDFDGWMDVHFCPWV